MTVYLEANDSIERAFSSYVKSCLRHAKKDYCKKICRDSAYMILFDAVRFEVEIGFIPHSSVSLYSPSDSLFFYTLFQLSLSEKEKTLIYYKYIEDKTDKEIAQLIGISRQAVTKLKAHILLKLKLEVET